MEELSSTKYKSFILYNINFTLVKDECRNTIHSQNHPSSAPRTEKIVAIDTQLGTNTSKPENHKGRG